jgi:hypothetical protein
LYSSPAANEERGDALAAEINEAGGKAHFVGTRFSPPWGEDESSEYESVRALRPFVHELEYGAQIEEAH